MEDIAAWCGKQLDEDERGAREACDRDSGEWFVGRKWNVYREEDTAPYEDQDEHDLVVYGNVLAQSEHIARHDPARVLREVAAKRRILAEHEHVTATEPSTHGFGCKICAYDRGDCVQYGWGWCNTVRLLTDAYADRDGYNPAWRVTT